MLNSIIRFALTHRFAVLFTSVFLIFFGSWIGGQLAVDVFPDLNKPRVVVLSEAHGLAPEEVEQLVTIPIESTLNGTPGVTDIRSTSGIGLSIIYVDFDWGTDIFRNRQLVSERLQEARSRLPEDIETSLGPITSIMGEIQFLSLQAESDDVSPLELRSLADWVIRPAIMGTKGVSQVVVMGGDVKQYQILLNPEQIVTKQLSLNQVKQALRQISRNTTGGVLNDEDRELLIRPLARVGGIADIENTVVGMQFGRPVYVKDIAKVKIGGQEKRGNASVDAKPAVVMTVQKQPGADTIALTRDIEVVVEKLKQSLPTGVTIRTDLFKQANFIELAIANVAEALRDGAIMVAIVLFLFMLNFRTTLITLTAIPLSFVITFVIFHILGLSINTMTLGGLAIAIGELVDDAIVDVENVFRRLRENNQSSEPKHPLKVVYEASKEIRNSLVVSTAIVVAVFVPLFALSGLEGRLFTPLGISYIISLIASLLVSITLTPVLCYLLLPGANATKHVEDTFVIRKTKSVARPLIKGSIKKPIVPIALGFALLVVAALGIMNAGRNFLPHFNEGTATIGVASFPGISLAASDELGTRIEKAILSVPEVKSTVRRTGRAEMDEHAEGVHWSEIDVDFHREQSRTKEVILDDIRKNILAQGDVYVNIGQPISHRIDHMMSGIRAEIALKIFGADLIEMRRIAVEMEEALGDIKGLVDIQIEPLIKIPQVAVEIDRDAASERGLSPGLLAEELEALLAGSPIASFIDQIQKNDIIVRLDISDRDGLEKIEQITVGKTPIGAPIKLYEVAEVYETDGPNMLNRDGLRRRLVVSANTSGRALTEIVSEVKESIDKKVNFPAGYYYDLGGKFEAEQAASQRMLWLGLLSVLAILAILYASFGSLASSVIVLVNIPLALIGSVAGIYLAGLDLSLATLVAFITLCGIASRNGLLMVNHYRNLFSESSDPDVTEVLLRGTLERLIPVLMTAGTAVLALSPLLLSEGEPGKEILFPVAVVIVGGLVTSTLLNTFVTPALVYLFRNRVFKSSGKKSEAELLS